MEGIQKHFGKLIIIINLILLLSYIIFQHKKFLILKIQMKQLFVKIMLVLVIIIIQIIILGIHFLLEKFLKIKINQVIIVIIMIFKEKIIQRLKN